MENMLAHHMTLMLPGEHEARNKGEVIHSGHFMISSVADQDELDDDDSHDRDSPVHHDQARRRQGYDFSEVSKETQNTYQFGHRSTNQITIDASLARLFECMSLAYRGGKVVSPKWKNFKGMRLSVKDKIRLNNAIWRTWHIQYIMRKRRSKLSFVQFATPLDTENDCDSHSRPEAVVMEGKYWKRRIETVVAEYKKWRAFFMEKLQQSDHPGLTWVSNQSPPTPESFCTDLMKGDDAIFMDFTNQLFSRFSQPFQFPNPREIAQHATNSDMMQPGLLQLQPSIEDFMDPLDTLQDIFSPTRKSPAVNGTNNVSLFYSGNNSQSSVQNQDFMITQNDLSAHGLQEASLEELVHRATGHDPNIMCMPEQHGNNIPATLIHQQEPAQVQMQTTNNINYGVSDPMLTGFNEKMFPNTNQFSNAIIPTSSPNMISKRHQSTPTISQVVMARSQHIHPQQSNDPLQHQEQMKTQTVMPPPIKKAPRRKSSNNNFNNMGGNTNSAVPLMSVNVAPSHQSLNNNEMPIPMNYQPVVTHFSNNNTRGQTQLSQTFPTTTLQQVIITSQMGNYTVTQQPNQMQMDKIDHASRMNLPAMQPVQQSINVSNRNATQHNSNIQKGNSQVPALIPLAMARSIPNQGTNSFDQPPQKKPLLANLPSNGVIKQSYSTPVNSLQAGVPGRQQQALLKQLLSGRQTNTNKIPTSSLQVPSSILLTREAQLKNEQEQSANINPFQNSVLRAAAQMVVTPKPQHGTYLNPGINNNKGATISQITAANVLTTESIRPLLISMNTSTVNELSSEKNKISKISEWPRASPTQVTTMDMDEMSSSSKLKEGFVTAMEVRQKQSYHDVTSPASSTASSTNSDHRTPHFTAEQKRRCNIKSLCDRLQEILPEVSNHPSQRVSKAVLLNKSCNHIRQLQAARLQTTTEIQQKQRMIERLNEDISKFQQLLPATGAPVSRHHGDRMQIVFNEWVRDRTLRDWKFFIFSMIIEPFFVTYDQTVSVASLEELCRTCLMWLEKNCSLPSLREGVVKSLEELGTTTSILTDPSNLQQQAESAVQQTSRCSSNSSS